MNKKWWTWNGKQLAHPLTIVRRLIALPFLWVFAVAYFLAIVFGWGLDTAKDKWYDLGP